MPEALAMYLRTLNKQSAQEVWDWADGDPDAVHKIISIVAPLAGCGLPPYQV